MHISTALRDVDPFSGEGLGLPRLVDDTGNAFYLAMLRGVPARDIIDVEWCIKFLFCDVGGGVDGEVVGNGRKDDDGADEDSREETEKDVDRPSPEHGGMGMEEGTGRKERKGPRVRGLNVKREIGESQQNIQARLSLPPFSSPSASANPCPSAASHSAPRACALTHCLNLSL